MSVDFMYVMSSSASSNHVSYCLPTQPYLTLHGIRKGVSALDSVVIPLHRVWHLFAVYLVLGSSIHLLTTLIY